MQHELQAKKGTVFIIKYPLREGVEVEAYSAGKEKRCLRDHRHTRPKIVEPQLRDVNTVDSDAPPVVPETTSSEADGTTRSTRKARQESFIPYSVKYARRR